jgi:hypothetical protein
MSQSDKGSGKEPNTSFAVNAFICCKEHGVSFVFEAFIVVHLYRLFRIA